jgi:hypothetical protein
MTATPRRRGWLVGALVSAVLLAGCANAGATPLFSIKIDPTPTPTPSPGNAARMAFVEQVLAGELTYHADIHGSVNGAGNIVELTGVMDAAGLDYQFAGTYAFPGTGTLKYANRLVDGVAWVRAGTGAWAKDTAFSPDQTNNPFAFIVEADDVSFQKTETVGGRALHRVRFEDSLLITPRQVPAPNLTQERITRSWFELTLDDDGVPLDGQWRLEGKGRVSGQLQELILQADLVFTKVGTPMTIKAP